MARMIDADRLMAAIETLIDSTEEEWKKTGYKEEMPAHIVWMDAYDLVRDFDKDPKLIEFEKEMDPLHFQSWLREVMKDDEALGAKK